MLAEFLSEILKTSTANYFFDKIKEKESCDGTSPISFLLGIFQFFESAFLEEFLEQTTLELGLSKVMSTIFDSSVNKNTLVDLRRYDSLEWTDRQDNLRSSVSQGQTKYAYRPCNA